MYDNIYLQNRIGFNGKIKKTDLTAFDNGLKLALGVIFILAIVIYLYVFLSATNYVFTIDLFFENLLANQTLQILLGIIAFVGTLIYYCFSKWKHSVAFQVYLENDMLVIVFNEGKKAGMEYRMFLSEISNICVYKNNSFSFYCNNIEIDRNGKITDMKGTIKFMGGDSRVFVLDLQEYLGRKVKFVNKKD